MGDLPPGTYAELRRGRKPCPQCKAIIGAGRKRCPACDHGFGTASAEVEDEGPVRATVGSSRVVIPGTSSQGAGDLILLVPNGGAPADLTGDTIEAVRKWLRVVVERYTSTNELSRPALTVEALERWARPFHARESESQMRVKYVLRSLTQEEIVRWLT